MSSRLPISRLAAAAVLFLFPLISVSAEPSTREEIARDSSRTLYPFSSLTFRNTWTPTRWNSPGTANVLEVRALTPLTLWKQPTLLRIVVPYRTRSQLGTGLGDVRIFDLVTIKRNWGFWGLGPVVNLRNATALISDKIQAGAVAGAVYSANPWGTGALIQNLFSDQTAVSTIQPILAYQFSPVWSLGLGELPFVYDWNQGRFIFLPVGVQIGAAFPLSGQMVRAFFNPQFNLKNLPGISRWTLTLGVSFLVPFARE